MASVVVYKAWVIWEERLSSVGGTMLARSEDEPEQHYRVFRPTTVFELYLL
jgi:hypothetical protein